MQVKELAQQTSIIIFEGTPSSSSLAVDPTGASSAVAIKAPLKSHLNTAVLSRSDSVSSFQACIRGGHHGLSERERGCLGAA